MASPSSDSSAGQPITDEIHRSAGSSASAPTIDSSSSNHARSAPDRGEHRRHLPGELDAAIVHPLTDRLLAVGAGQRTVVVDRALLKIVPQALDREELRGLDVFLGEPDQPGDHVAARVLQRLDGTHRGRRRVVDLVRQPGGERAEGDERLALAGGRVDAADGLVDARDHVLGERRPLADESAEFGRRHGEHPARRCTATPVALVTACSSAAPHADSPPAHRPGSSIVASTIGLVADSAAQLDPAVEQDPQDRRRPPSSNSTSPGPKVRSSPTAIEFGALFVGERTREERASEVVGDGHTVSRYRCTLLTELEPSPTADATRFIDDRRTSPAANTPGTLVSSRNGWRSSGHARGVERGDVGPGEHEPVVVAGDVVAEPVGAWECADEHEQPVRVDLLLRRRWRDRRS